MKSNWLYMFKASGLQGYIFATNRLKDVVGASQLIEALTGSYLDEAIEACGFQDGEFTFVQRAAGQATLLTSNGDALERLVAVWPAICQTLAPNLSVQQWSGAVTRTHLFEHLQKGWEVLRHRRNTPPARLPELAPPALRAPASGEAAARVMRTSGGERELVDAATRQKRVVSKERGHVVAGLEPGDVREEWSGQEWALQTDDLALGEKTYLSVIHADGNRLGKFLIKLAEAARDIDDVGRVRDLYRMLSDGLGTATRNSVIAGLRACQFEPLGRGTLPARPVILGGDDVTILLPSTHAIDFTRVFLEAFEEHTEDLMTEIEHEHEELRGELEALTACAGIVFQRSRQPLTAGAEVSEHLCRFAKDNSRGEDGTASSLMFARLLDYNSQDLEHRLARDFIDEQSRMRLSAGPYAIHRDQGLASLEALEAVIEALHHRDVGVSGVRGVVDDLQIGSSQAQRSFERMVAVSGDAGQHLTRALDTLDSQLRGERPGGLSRLSALPDASLLHAVR